MGQIWIGDTNGVWIDLWEGRGFTGRTTRLWGPGDFPYLRVGSRLSKPLVLSLSVGPAAYVQGYEDLNFFDSVFWLLPNQKVEDVGALNCSDEIDSLRLFDRPPFGHEPGYAAYMLWAASRLSKAVDSL